MPSLCVVTYLFFNYFTNILQSAQKGFNKSQSKDMDKKIDKWLSDLRKLKIFGGNNDTLGALPGSGGGRNNGVSLNMVNTAVLISVVWLLCSVGVFGFGVWHCRYRSPYFAMKCDDRECNLLQGNNLPIIIPRREITGAQAVRLDANGDVVDATSMRSKASRRLGHSVEIKYQHGETKYKVEKKVLFATQDIGSSSAKQISKSILKSVYKPTEKIDVKHGFAITGLGLTSCILGVLSFILSLLFGQWADIPKRLKKHG